jgi:hypothetical protein
MKYDMKALDRSLSTHIKEASPVVQAITKPETSDRMLRMAVSLREAAEQAEATDLDSVCLVFVERGPDRFVTMRSAIDQGKYTLSGALSAAQIDILSEQ